MPTASSSIKPVSTIKVRLGIDANGKVQKFFTNACYRHMDKYVPRKDDNLRKNVVIKDNSIEYTQEYASYQYRGRRADGTRVVKKYTTPGTGANWDKKMVSAEFDEVVQETQDFMKGGS